MHPFEGAFFMSYILLCKVILPTAVILASPVILLTLFAVAVRSNTYFAYSVGS